MVCSLLLSHLIVCAHTISQKHIRDDKEIYVRDIYGTTYEQAQQDNLLSQH